MKNFIFLALLLASGIAHAKQFEIFDGRFYNGKFYPLVDLIEWGDQGKEFMEIHIHMKDPIDVAAVPGVGPSGKPVLWLMYDLKFRNERICRSVVAPSYFQEGMKLYAYRDNSDPDYDNIHLSSFPNNDKKFRPYTMPEYSPCTDELAVNKPEARSPASGGAVPVASTPPSGGVVAPGAPAAAQPKDPKNIGVDYGNSAVPFSF